MAFSKVTNFSRGPKLYQQDLIIAADAASSRSYSGSGNSVDNIVKHQGWTLTVDGSAAVSVSGDPAVVVNTGAGGSFRWSNSTYINWATTSFSVGAWVKRDNFTDIKQSRVVDFTNAGNGHLRLTFHNGQQHLYQRPTAGSSTELVGATQTLSTDTWYYFCVTKAGEISGNDADYKLYLDGAEIGSNTSNGLVTDSNFTVIRLMRSSDDDQTGISWDGDFGPYHIYTDALTADQVLQNYNAFKTRFK